MGRAIFLRPGAAYKNGSGELHVRDDALCFIGEVRIEIPWNKVVHVAVATDKSQGSDNIAVAVQEKGRRTPTTIAFPCADRWDYGGELACRIVSAAWSRARSPESDADGAAELPLATATSAQPPDWSGYGYLGAVGESHYQSALERLARKGRFHCATLVPEPNNAFDSNAVVVQVEGETIGYLSRQEARRYQRRLLGREPIPIPAKLIGGTTDKPNFGVLLDCRAIEALPSPKRTRKKVEPFDHTDQPF